MHAFGGVGKAMLVPGGLILVYLLAIKLFAGAAIGGRPLLLLGAILLLMGVQLIALGLLGELLIRIYHEPAGRSHYQLREAPRWRDASSRPPNHSTQVDDE